MASTITAPARQDPRALRPQGVALGGFGAALDREHREGDGDATAGQHAVDRGRGQQAEQIRRGAADGDELLGRGVRGGGQRRPRDLTCRVDLGGCRRIRGDEVLREPRRPEADADRAHGPLRAGDDELAAAASYVDDEHLRAHAAALGHAEQREHRLLLRLDDVEGDVGARLGLADERHRVESPTDRLRADDRQRAGPEPSRRGGVAREGVDDVETSAWPDPSVARDTVAQAEEHGLVDERFDAVAGDSGDEQVDAVRADVDGGTDRAVVDGALDRPTGHGSGGYDTLGLVRFGHGLGSGFRRRFRLEFRLGSGFRRRFGFGLGSGFRLGLRLGSGLGLGYRLGSGFGLGYRLGSGLGLGYRLGSGLGLGFGRRFGHRLGFRFRLWLRRRFGFRSGLRRWNRLGLRRRNGLGLRNGRRRRLDLSRRLGLGLRRRLGPRCSLGFDRRRGGSPGPPGRPPLGVDSLHDARRRRLACPLHEARRLLQRPRGRLPALGFGRRLHGDDRFGLGHLGMVGNRRRWHRGLRGFASGLRGGLFGQLRRLRLRLARRLARGLVGLPRGLGGGLGDLPLGLRRALRGLAIDIGLAAIRFGRVSRCGTVHGRRALAGLSVLRHRHSSQPCRRVQPDRVSTSLTQPTRWRWTQPNGANGALTQR